MKTIKKFTHWYFHNYMAFYGKMYQYNVNPFLI